MGCQDLNLGPHPYQLNFGNRCADRPFPRSAPTVGAEGMRSTIMASTCAGRRAHRRWYPCGDGSPAERLAAPDLWS